MGDGAMERLGRISRRSTEYKGEVSSDLINFILQNDDFWDELNGRLPIIYSMK